MEPKGCEYIHLTTLLRWVHLFYQLNLLLGFLRRGRYMQGLDVFHLQLVRQNQSGFLHFVQNNFCEVSTLMQEKLVWGSYLHRYKVWTLPIFWGLDMKGQKCVVCGRDHAPHPGVGTLESFQYRVLNWTGNCSWFVHKNTPQPDVEIAPVWVHIRINILISLFVVL